MRDRGSVVTIMPLLRFVGLVCLYAVLAAAITLATAFTVLIAVGLWLKANDQFGLGWFFWLFPAEFGLLFLILLYNKPKRRT